MAFIEIGEYTLASGRESRLKIECDNLGADNVDVLSYLLAQTMLKALPPGQTFRDVLGVPRGGLAVADSFRRQIPYDPKSQWVGVVDDVVTTGKSLMDFVEKGVCYERGVPRNKIIAGALFTRGHAWDIHEFNIPYRTVFVLHNELREL